MARRSLEDQIPMHEQFILNRNRISYSSASSRSVEVMPLSCGYHKHAGFTFARPAAVETARSRHSGRACHNGYATTGRRDHRAQFLLIRARANAMSRNHVFQQLLLPLSSSATPRSRRLGHFHLQSQQKQLWYGPARLLWPSSIQSTTLLPLTPLNGNEQRTSDRRQLSSTWGSRAALAPISSRSP